MYAYENLRIVAYKLCQFSPFRLLSLIFVEVYMLNI